MNVATQRGLFEEIESGAVLSPEYENRTLQGLPPASVFKELAARDWSFTEEKTNLFTHDVHPYPAKFIPQIPNRLISALSCRGDLVLDPFGGSGTTAVEALRLGRRALSIDANPISALIGRVKCMTLSHQTSQHLTGFAHELSQGLTRLPVTPGGLVAQFAEFAPHIPNREKWFSDTAFGELAFIRSRIMALGSEDARDIAVVALSRIALKASFQDSETRYKSVPRKIAFGETVQMYLREFGAVCRSVQSNSEAMRHGVAKFVTADARSLEGPDLPDYSVDLVVTSPPYGNATDYHLYHRFRLLWLGHDPKRLCDVEIGSHLKHQREQSGFSKYKADLELAIARIERALKPGRWAVFVLGDSLYEGKVYHTADILRKASKAFGFDAARIIERPIHSRKRSFAAPARRASTESILFLRRRSRSIPVRLLPPPYRLWPYEAQLCKDEVARLTRSKKTSSSTDVTLEPDKIGATRRLVFTHAVQFPGGYREPTWQAILENGLAGSASARKDPKYATHGLHSYKGKYYPQLAKNLMNLSSLAVGSRILDPFCGSGTTLLEAYLSGYRGLGCDMNPTAARIAEAKIGVLELPPDIVAATLRSILDQRKTYEQSLAKLEGVEEFHPDCVDEIKRWFAPAISAKLNALLHTIRNGSTHHVVNFLEVVASSIVRDISHQDPSDLRIRYRTKRLTDADVFGQFADKLSVQLQRLEKFWAVRGWAPHPFFPSSALLGDSRDRNTFDRLGASPESVDLVLTSPPYATALPYIDTDRLSLATIFGVSSTDRRPIELQLIGSREITKAERIELEKDLAKGDQLPVPIVRYLRSLNKKLDASDAGFRRRNMPVLLGRFFVGMRRVLQNSHSALKPGAEAMLVIGDNRMEIGGHDHAIPTASFVELVAQDVGFTPAPRMPITVTTENMLHQKNAITENVVLRLRKTA